MIHRVTIYTIFADKLAVGDKLPVGGSIFGHNKFLQLDDPFAETFEKMDKKAQTGPRDGLESARQATGLDFVGLDLYARLMVCTLALGTKFKPIEPPQERCEKRTELYEQQGTLALSKLLTAGLHMCAEAASFAHLYLQRTVAEVYSIGGSVVYGPDKAPSPHHFLVLLQETPAGTEALLYDPANPLPAISGEKPMDLPRVWRIAPEVWRGFVEWITKPTTTTNYFKVHNPAKGETWLYGSFDPVINEAKDVAAYW